MLSGALCHPNIPLLFETMYVICKGSFPKEDKVIHLYLAYREYARKMSWIFLFFPKATVLYVCGGKGILLSPVTVFLEVNVNVSPKTVDNIASVCNVSLTQ